MFLALRSRLGHAPTIGIVALLAVSTAAFADLTEIESVSSDGQQGNDVSGRYAGPAISGDGAVVAFDSMASTLVPGDTNQQADVFVHDRTTGATERVSVRSDGAQANGTSTRPAIDGDGD